MSYWDRFEGWRPRRRSLIIAGGGMAASIVALAITMPGQVTWSDAKAAVPVAGAVTPVLAIDAAVLADPALTLDHRPVTSGGAMTAHGVVRSGEEAVIASRMTALITALPLQAGQSFGRGQLLASFDCSQMRAQLAAANAASAAYRTTYSNNVELDKYKAIGTNDVAVSRANLAKAVAEAGAVQAATSQCAIYAPFSGMVIERIAHPHDVAAAGQPLMKIQGSGDLQVELIVPSNSLTWLKPGTPFRFAIDETGGIVEGKIVRLGAAVDPVSKTMRVTGSITVAGTVTPGMSGTARFVQGGDVGAE